MSRFEGRVATVLGGGCRMGGVNCHRLSVRGARVYVTDLTEEAAISAVQPREISGLAFFLANGDAGFCTGAALPVDRGVVAK